MDSIQGKLAQIARQQGGYLTFLAVIEQLQMQQESQLHYDQIETLYRFFSEQQIQLVDELPEGVQTTDTLSNEEIESLKSIYSVEQQTTDILSIEEYEVGKRTTRWNPLTTENDWGALQDLWERASVAESLESQYDDDIAFQLIEYAEQNDGHVPYHLITAIAEEKRLTYQEVEDLCCFLQESGWDIENLPIDGEVGAQEFSRESLECMEIWPYLQEVRKIPHCSAKEEQELSYRRDLGDTAALERLWVSQLRFVIVLSRYLQGKGLPLADLIQEANFGLRKAIERFDPQRGINLFHYAGFWIRQAGTRAIADHARLIRLPVHLEERITTYYEIYYMLSQKLSRNPTNQEIAAAMVLPIKTLEGLAGALDEPLSLDELLQDNDIENNGSEEEIASFPNYYCTEQDVENQGAERSLAEKIDCVLGTLTGREQKVLIMRFGLEDGYPHTLEEVGQSFGVTRERIRQIEVKALGKLKYSSRSQILIDFE
ncbi:MAG: sigma-70 family RNA polymerase sigma factor [bacterium]